MEDNWHTTQGNPGQNLFVDYATVADSIGVYTTGDYAEIVEHLVRRWKVAELRVSGGRAAQAQEYLCKHSERIRRLADLQMERKLRERKRGKGKTAGFSWIFKREVSLFRVEDKAWCCGSFRKIFVELMMCITMVVPEA
eukprot:365377-Chlamydomonas_euryale.AAC.21